MRQHTLKSRAFSRSAALAGLAVIGASQLPVTAAAQGKTVLGTGVATPAAPTVPGANWSFIGPNNTVVSKPATVLGMGPTAVAGRVNAVAYDLKNSNIYYAATAAGGIWKTVDKGVTWVQLTLANPYGYSYSSVVVDPVDDTIVYVGTGDYDGLRGLGTGILKIKFPTATATSGYTINATVQANSQALFTNHTIRKIVIDPQNHSHIIAAAGRNQSQAAIETYARTRFPLLPVTQYTIKPQTIQYNVPDGFIANSYDGGTTWTVASTNQYIPAFKPATQIPANGTGQPAYFSDITYGVNPAGTLAAKQVLYASADFYGVLRSTDNGLTWQAADNLNSGSNNILTGIDVTGKIPQQVNPKSMRVAIAPSTFNASTLYVLSEKDKAIYQTVDGGTSWQTISFSLASTDAAGNDVWATSSQDFTIAVSKATTSTTGAFGQPGKTTTVDVVYLGLDDVFQSPSGADNWIPIGNVYTGYDNLHPGIYGFTVNPFNPNETQIATEGGIYHLIYAPGISNYSFTSLNATLGVSDLLGGAFGFLDPTQILVSSFHDGAPHRDGGNTTWKNPGDYKTTFTAINPMLFGTQYVAGTFTNAGASFRWTEDDWAQTFGSTPIPADLSAAQPPLTQAYASAPVVMDRYNPDYIYNGQQHVILGAHVPGNLAGPATPPTIGTMTWTNIGNSLAQPTVDTDNPYRYYDYITSLNLSQFDNRYLYAGTNNGLQWFSPDRTNFQLYSGFIDTGNLFQITRGDGSTVTQRYFNTVPQLNGLVSAIGTSTKKPKTVYLGFSKHFNQGLTQLALATAVGDTTITLDSVAGFRFGDQVYVDGEYFNITKISQQNVTITLNGALTAIHDVGAQVYDVTAGSGNLSNIYRITNIDAGFFDQNTGYWIPTPTVTDISGSGGGKLPNIPINSIEVIPHDSDQIIYVSTDQGVFYTVNGGASWVNGGLDGSFPLGVGVSKVHYEPSTSYLYATTKGLGVWAKYIPSDPVLGPLFKSAFKLYPTLQNYRGNRAKLNITVKFQGGGQPITGTAPTNASPIPQPIEGDINKLDASGWWLSSVSVQGAFDVWFKVDGFLSKRMKSVGVANNSIVSPLIIAGDCNPVMDAVTGLIIGHGDNVIDINDVNACLLHMGQLWTGPEDVDGDGIVTARDLALIQANLGQKGDQ